MTPRIVIHFDGSTGYEFLTTCGGVMNGEG